jgi:hypothetical protein
MKKTIFTALIIFIGLKLFSQNLTCNCNTDFWTINSDGYIQQWSLSNGTVNGGDTVLSGGGTSLSYCGNSNAPTFYSNNYNSPYTGFSFYQPGSGWINIPGDAVNNNGGYLNNQYYMIEGGIIQIVKYWDGVNFLTVDSLHVHGQFFAGTQDIAVDTLGQAWIFTGPVPSTVDSLKVYNKFGKINSYSIQFNIIAYGSFFLNDTLYLGTYQDSIFPVIVNGGIAQLGNPIPFPAYGFTDMASCQKSESTISISEYPHTQIILFPNPTSGYLMLPQNIERSSISVYNSQGQLIRLKYNGKILDLTEQPSGIYFIKINSIGVPNLHKIIKL